MTPRTTTLMVQIFKGMKRFGLKKLYFTSINFCDHENVKVLQELNFVVNQYQPIIYIKMKLNSKLKCKEILKQILKNFISIRFLRPKRNCSFSGINFCRRPLAETSKQTCKFYP